MRYVLTWLVLAVGIAIGVGGLNLPSYSRLVKRGVPAQATVVELLPKVHNTLRYEYRVAGRALQGQGQTWPPNPPLELVTVGQSLVIYYDPEHPEESVLGDPKPMLENEAISVGLAATLAPTFVVGVWAWKTSRRRMDQRVNPPSACQTGSTEPG